MSEQLNDNMSDTQENTDKMAQDSTLENEVNIDGMDNDGQPTTEHETDHESAKLKSIEDQLGKMQAELEETKDKHLRLIAEFDNFRRRSAKEKIEFSLTASKEVMQALLVVLDDMGRAEKQLEKETDVTKLKEGVTLVFNKLRTVLQHKGLKEMEFANDEFNADLHEAITEIPAPGKNKVGKVMDVVEPGYYLNEKLIRHAKVVVGK